MNNYNQNLNSFCLAFSLKEMKLALISLNNCFQENPKITFQKLYQKKYFLLKDFLEIDFTSIQIPEEYRLLLEIIRQNNEEIKNASIFIDKYSKGQILQGVANVLEKTNTVLKYNENWNLKHVTIDANYLETERQGVFISSAGIEFQELLDRFYFSSYDSDILTIVWNENTDILFTNLLNVLKVYSNIKDTIERHLFFNWSLVIDDKMTLKIIPPLNQRESKIETDIINNLKLKLITKDIDDIALFNLKNGYIEKFENKNKKSGDFWKYRPNENNKKEIDWFTEALMLDVKADYTVERNLAIYIARYFPGIKDLKDLDLKDGTKLPLRETFRILGFLSELSKKHINEIDKQYTEGVNYYSKIIPTSSDSEQIEIKSRLHKGDNESLKVMLEEHCNEDVIKEHENIINGAKSLVKNEDCLIRFDFDLLIKTIQWIHQYEADFIKEVIEIFVFNESKNTGVTRAPFFKIGSDLCWMPNLVAFTSFAENLLENLLANRLISIHHLQTEYFEKNLNNIFKGYGYKVIVDETFKKFKNEKCQELGDFDLLAYKDGSLIYMELKLTNTRNSFFERKLWKDKKLMEAKNQLEKGLKYIQENPDHIKKILGLAEREIITNTNAFIISNSHLFDHENIGDFLKIGYFEAMLSLIITEESNKNDSGNAEKYVKFINENRLFSNYEKLPLVIDNLPIKVGDYCILQPGLVQKNLYTAL